MARSTSASTWRLGPLAVVLSACCLYLVPHSAAADGPPGWTCGPYNLFCSFWPQTTDPCDADFFQTEVFPNIYTCRFDPVFYEPEDDLDIPAPIVGNMEIGTADAVSENLGLPSCRADTNSQGSALVGNPINPLIRNKVQYEVDFVGAGRLPLTFGRVFNSKAASVSNSGSTWPAVGRKWDIALPRLQLWTPPGEPAGTEGLINVRPDGQTVRYINRHSATSGMDVYVRINGEIGGILQNSTGGWIRQDGTRTERYDSYGRIRLLTDTHGEYLKYDYTDAAQRYPYRIRHSSGRILNMAFKSNGQLDYIILPTGEYIYYTHHSSGNLSSVDYPHTASQRAVRQYFYEKAGFPDHLTRIVDETGRTHLWTYDSQGDAVSSERLNGVDKTQIVAESVSGSTTSVLVRNPLGRETTYRHELTAGNKKLVNVEGYAIGNCAASLRSMTYDANGYYESTTDAEGNVVHYDYDELGNLKQIKEAPGTLDERTTDYDFHPNLDLPERIENAIQKTEIEYDDPTGLPESVKITSKVANGTTSPIRESQISYQTQTTSEQTEMVTQIVLDGPRTDVNDVTTINYNATTGNATSIVNAVGHTIQLQNHDAAGRVQRIIYPSGRKIELDYHPRGWVTEKRDYVASRRIDGSMESQIRVTEYEYEKNGQLRKITFPDGTWFFFIYDIYNRLVQINNPIEEHIIFDYDTAGNVTEERIAHTQTTTQWVVIGYDQDGEPIMEQQTTYQQLTDKTTEYDYDALDRLEQITDGNSNSTLIRYDKNDLVKLVEDARGYQTTQQYNERNELKTQLNPDGGAVGTTFDDNALLKTVVDAINVTTTYTRNGFGEIKVEDSPDSGVWEYEYDSAGNLIRVEDGRDLVTTYTYDELNRVDTIAHPDYSGNTAFAYDTSQPGYLDRVTDYTGYTDFEYNEAGELIKKTAHVVGVSMVTEYEYDVAGRVTHSKMPGGTELFYSYDTVGRVSRIEVDHPSFSRQDLVNNITYKPFGPMRGLTLGSGETRTLTYDGAYRLSQLVSGAHIHKTFGYDANNNITSVTDGLGAPLRTYDYDEMDRLDYHSGVDGVFEYGYDANGNRTRKNSTFDNYFYAANTNRLESAPEFNLDYNENGAVKQRGAIVFGINNRNRLWQTADYSIPKYTNYFFNTFGERVYKYVHNGTFNQRFVYGGGGQLLHERGSQGTIDYVYLNGQPIAMIKDGSIFYLHTDHLGRPEVATNWAGVVAWSIEANAWSSDSISGGLTVNLRFPGQYYDVESGLHYNYFRFYDPVTGRYLSADPIGLAGGMNLFAYAGSNPVNAIDPLGLSTVAAPAPPPPSLFPALGGSATTAGGAGTLATGAACVAGAGVVGVAFGIGVNHTVEQTTGLSIGNWLYNMANSDEYEDEFLDPLVFPDTGGTPGGDPDEDPSEDKKNASTPTDRYRDILDQRHLDAARRELRGEVVKRNWLGRPFDHVQEVRNAQQGVANRIAAINRRLGSPSSGLSDAERAALVRELSQASRLLDYSRHFVP